MNQLNLARSEPEQNLLPVSDEIAGIKRKLYCALDKPAISVIGLGYVGAVSVACLSNHGYRTVGVDIDIDKVNEIRNGISPIHEKDLGSLLEAGVQSELISATTSVEEAVADTDVTFVSVGTPTKEDGGCDYSHIISAARMIGQGLKQKDNHHVVVMRCSIPPGTTLKVMVPEIEAVSGRNMGQDFSVCFNPEFLREGTAIEDFENPPKTVIGANSDYAAQVLSRIYADVDDNIISTSIEVAEMVKYVDNVWHANKVCFGNEVGRICKALEIDSHEVMEIFVQDTKLNLSPYYLKPGFAYGGSCLPKEVRAVEHLAKIVDARVPLIESLGVSNNAQIAFAITMLTEETFQNIGILGVAFKAGTDDLRESPILEVIHELLKHGKTISVYDEAVTAETQILKQFQYVESVCPHLRSTVEHLSDMLSPDLRSIAENSDVLVVTQRTEEFQRLVSDAIDEVQIVDLVRLFDKPPSSPNYVGIGW